MIAGVLLGLLLSVVLFLSAFLVGKWQDRRRRPAGHQAREVPTPAPVRDCYCHRGGARGLHGLPRCILVGRDGRLDHYTAHPDVVRDLPELFPSLETWMVGTCDCGQPAAEILHLQDHRARLVCGSEACLDGAATLTSEAAGT